MRKERMDPMDDPHQVDVEYPSPILECDFIYTPGGGDTGVVTQHVDVSEPLERRLGGTLDTDGIGDVAGNTVHVRTKIMQLHQGGGQRIGLDVGEHYFHARLRKGSREREPDAACPA